MSKYDPLKRIKQDLEDPEKLEVGKIENPFIGITDTPGPETEKSKQKFIRDNFRKISTRDDQGTRAFVYEKDQAIVEGPNTELYICKLEEAGENTRAVIQKKLDAAEEGLIDQIYEMVKDKIGEPDSKPAFIPDLD